MPGDGLLAGRYRLVQRLGEGGAGTVWRAIDETLHRDVALKQVRVPEGLDPRQRAVFADQAIHEARSAGRLRDPAIVLIHDVVLDGDQPWIVMDLSTGRSLDKVIKEYGPLPPAEVARIGLAILGALRVAHAHGILHQDVKPANILIDADGSAMLTDFGIAAPMGGQGDRTGSAGSPGYMAPERLNGLASGPASDLWSLGASLYTAVQGQAPFERAMQAAVAAAVLLHEPPFPVPAGRELGALLMAMLAKDPAERPTAEQVGAALASTPQQVAGQVKPRRRWVLPAVLAGVLALGAGGWYGVAALGGEEEIGRFATAPDPCGLLTDTQAAELLGGAVKKIATRAGECRWERWEGSRTPRVLTVRTAAERPRGGQDGPATATTVYNARRATKASAKGEVFGLYTGKITDYQGVGDAAFAQATMKTWAKQKQVRVTITGTFRISNLIGEVVLDLELLSKLTQAEHDAAAKATRTVAAALG
ncbi:serine/threonine protein kinase [Nonomuraea sp. NBC_01738]|uniref:serine/threonine-protein kinase n=1 Tax=Nonomuraea sp. NBC_01738 TaxID=2976003 RepID=UPI002E165884|nr:serine/threonine protein kinase [Nonomuraea sp. NBC_01738]